MTDITSLLNEALGKHSVSLSKFAKTNLLSVDEFLKEAYRINSHISTLHTYLRSIRPAYLSTTPPRRSQLSYANPSVPLGYPEKERRYLTDVQRDEIDAESKQLLHELNAAIRNLSDAELIRQNTETVLAKKKHARYPFGALGRWAASGGQEKSEEELLDEARIRSVKVHRESVIWYLRRKLEECGELQRGMMETRLIREVEKSKSALYKTQGTASAPTKANGGAPNFDSIDVTNTVNGMRKEMERRGVLMDEQETKEIEEQLSPEQLQLFARENQDMLKHYEDTLDQVRTAERSLVEISELQTTLVNNLATQSEHIDQLVADSFQTTENVGGGNKQLKKAAERKSTAKYVFYGTVAFSGFLIIYDLLI
ncbi:hypothetical protein FGG08_001543 [Glutinoglossum americanum]|uniref:t-SNARE coiled-coil homology domain-containing protein n=1 Tax=Glutinoglossum americanum TaxID=1670608 RepID=A0A9P8IB22_9PEZI|nr:hypothetical protein FGG08_001543 [Glutinoglossum americanum]